MDYEEVRVQLSPASNGEVRASFTLNGMAAPIEHTFIPPEDIDAERLYRDWLGSFKPGSEVSRDDLARQRDEIGHRLFKILFGNVAAELRERLTAIEHRRAGDEVCGFRFRLVLGDAAGPGPLEASDLLRVSRIPWELCMDRERQRHLAKSRFISIVRTIGAQQPPRPVKIRVEGKLRVLVVDAQPKDATPLNWPAEKARIKRAFKNWKYADLKFLDHASFEKTCWRLEEGRFHVLHFIGHGGYRKSTGQWSLLFEKKGEKDRVYAPDIASRLGNIQTLKVAVFNACRSGELPGEEDSDPLSGIAAAVSVAGVPVVVAMQIPVTDGMAIEFSEAFYKTLRTGLPVEAAVAEGRQVVRLSSPEWATPVLYLRGASSELFDFRTMLAETSHVPVDRSEDLEAAPEELILGIRSFVESKDYRLAEWAIQLNETTERFLPLEEHFQGRFIRGPEEWNNALLPQLDEFLSDAVHQHRPLVLCLAAHATVAFAAGYFFHTKEDTPLSLLQMTAGKPFRWSAGQGAVPEGPLWQPFVEESLDTKSQDVAVAVEITQSTSEAVKTYIEKSGISIGWFVSARIAGEPGKIRVESGAHAFQLAWQLHQWLKDHTGDRSSRRLHLFISAPNGFVFFFGQLARSLGPLCLYEYDFEVARHGTYEQSLLIQ